MDSIQLLANFQIIIVHNKIRSYSIRAGINTSATPLYLWLAKIKSEKFPTVGCRHPCLSVAVAISWASAYLKPHEDWLAELLLEAEAEATVDVVFCLSNLRGRLPP